MNRRRIPALLAILITLGASACGSASDPASTDPAPADPTTEESEAHDGTESASAAPRLALTHDGGVMIVDVSSGEVVAEEELEGFVRISPAGDGRHVLVHATGGWQALDLGSWGHEHGDHGHHYTGTAGLTGVSFPAEEPGHVVAHDGLTTLFDDGTGTAVSFAADDLEDGEPELTSHDTGGAHHGVAVAMADRNVIHTVGTEDERSGVRLTSPAGLVLAETDDCPGVHGEAFAEDAAVLGCEDGAVVVSGREIRKVESPDAYGRIGNQAGSDASPVCSATTRPTPTPSSSDPRGSA